MTFPLDQLYCVLDYETYSEADLKKVGGYEYSKHPSTEVLCLAWKVGTRDTLRNNKTKYWAPGGLGLMELVYILNDPKFILVAHNALFEQVITNNVLVRYHAFQPIPPKRWLCTASLAAALALPRKLEGAAEALALPVQKDMEGNRLILKWCKPKKPSKKDPSTRHSDSIEFGKIIKYCMTDVDATAELFLKLPPLTALERMVWELDQTINLRGFLVDTRLVDTVLGMIGRETAFLGRETAELSDGALTTTNQRAAVLAWLEENGAFVSDLTAKTVKESLEMGLVDGKAKRMLEIRQAISKTSTAKYQAFRLRSRHDGRLRDILLYHGASTGRWGGMGVQPQNFPRGTIKNTTQAADILATGDLELVRMIYGDPMSVFSSCLRNMIIAPEGETLDVADYAAIEARVLFWVARHEEGLKAFREGRDLYREIAAEIFGVDISKVTSAMRFVGKGVILGCGYSMGAKKFAESCKNQGQEIESRIAEVAVKAYRSAHQPVVKLWDNIHRASIAAVQNPGKRYTINRTIWFCKDDFLWCELPSGRKLAYAKPSVQFEKTPWGDMRPCLYHYGVNSMSRKWERQKTYGGRLTENVVQAIARDFMAEAMLRIESKKAWKIVLSVHDELIAQRNINSHYGIKDFENLMSELPYWGTGCPIKVEGWTGIRYRK